VLLLFIWLLPFHIVTMAALFGLLGVPAPVVRALAAWKESVVLLLMIVIAASGLTGRGPRIIPRPTDLAVGGLGLVAFVYLLGAQSWFAADLPVGAQVLGWRDAVFFTLVYFVGRATPEVVRDARYIHALVAVGVLTSAIAILERLLVTPAMLVWLGVSHYVQEYLGLTITTIHNPFGLPDSYWTGIGDQLVQRAGSTYLSSQGFAIPFLVILPAATLTVLRAERWRLGAWTAAAMVWLGLLLTITRMTLVACAVQVLVLLALWRRWGVAVGGGLLLTVSLAVAFLAVPNLASFALETVTFESASSVSHLEDWSEGVEHLGEHPLGVGLGAGGLTGARFGLPPVAADSQYFKYAVELGVLGLGLYLAALAALFGFAARAYRASPTPIVRAYAALVAVTALGIGINGLTTVPLAHPLLAYTFFWIAGALVSAADDRGTA